MLELTRTPTLSMNKDGVAPMFWPLKSTTDPLSFEAQPVILSPPYRNHKIKWWMLNN